MGCDDFVGGRRPFRADKAKRIADWAPIEAAQFANQAALTTILTAIQTAALAGTYFINVDTTTLTGADIPFIVNYLAARMKYNVQTIGTNMNIDWSMAGYGKVGDTHGFWNRWWANGWGRW